MFFVRGTDAALSEEDAANKRYEEPMRKLLFFVLFLAMLIWTWFNYVSL